MEERGSIDMQKKKRGSFCAGGQPLLFSEHVQKLRRLQVLVTPSFRQGVSTPAACRALLGAGCIVMRKMGFLAPGSLRLGRQLEKEADVCSAV